MSSYHDTMQVCKKWGHKITEFYDSYPQHRQEFCHKCGSQTTTVCGHCDVKIKGHYHVEGVIGGGKKEVPLHCHSCGTPYPWKWRLLLVQTAEKLIAPFKYIIDVFMSWFKK